MTIDRDADGRGDAGLAGLASLVVRGSGRFSRAARGLRSFPCVSSSRRSRARRWCLALGLGVCALAVGAPAWGSMLVARPGGDVHVSEARVALSSTTTQSIVWEQLVIDVTRGDLAWIVALPPGAWIEVGDPTWFPSLDAATAPVIAPARSLGCADPPPLDDTAEPASTALPRVVDGPLGAPSAGSDALAALIAAGYLVDDASAARLRAFDTSGEQVLVLKLPAGARGTTPVVRVVGPPGRALPLALMPTQAPPPISRAWIFGATRVRLDGAPNVEPTFDGLVWDGDQSNYATLLAEARAASPNGFVVPYASRDGLFADEATGSTGVTLASLTRGYFGAIDASSSAAWTCARVAAGDAAKSAPVAGWCGSAASWASTGVSPSCPTAPQGALPTSDFVCGDKVDLAAAMAGQIPSSTWLTRFEIDSIAAGAFTPIDAALGTLPAFHEAKVLSAAGCTGPSGASPGTSGSSGTSGTPSQPNAGSGGSGDLPGPPGPSTAQVVDDGCSAGQSFADGCSSNGSSASSGCDSSSSSSSSSSCGGSSSSSSDSGCGGGSGSSGDSGCSGSGSTSGDSGCGSGGGGSSGSSGCSGSGGGSGDNGCRVARVRRVRATGFGYLLLAALAMARRSARRRR